MNILSKREKEKGKKRRRKGSPKEGNGNKYKNRKYCDPRRKRRRINESLEERETRNRKGNKEGNFCTPLTLKNYNL